MLTGIIFIVVFAIGHCIPIVVAGSSTAMVKRLLTNSTWQQGGRFFRRIAGTLIARRLFYCAAVYGSIGQKNMSPNQRRKVLFLCTGNSCRSQMAEGLLRHLAAGRFDACSAGLAPQDRIHPLAIQVMAEIGIDMSGQKPKSVKTYLGKATISYIITVCTKAEEDTCPRIWPGVADINRLYWPFDDPAAAEGTDEENNKSSGWSGIHSGRKSLIG